ncbi:hypothetical protein [Candidatus Viridilinea mediisalina]|uniref:VCBS repeat-containing protein n=1 Tax=Candidatus Viridilinea mediisalina TaxID=2024553 RepID=A0A2A6RED9_9CHLR|nr:hypothetical protein [Candidatus Viridilinea mediisalina]PDW00813.1 hypothetical protein CJ255_20175 [Candidatus Viridilinea mediisalina]
MVRSQDIRPARRTERVLPTRNVGTVAYVITGLIAVLAAYVVLGSLFGWLQTLMHDVQYGRPRTFHLVANVGRPEEVGAPTHLIAMNLDRQVVILELPGGDAAKVRVLPGPYLFGAGEDLTPVTMRLADMNGNGAPDLVVRVKNEEMVYLNREEGFNLITAEERQQLVRQTTWR